MWSPKEQKSARTIDKEKQEIILYLINLAKKGRKPNSYLFLLIFNLWKSPHLHIAMIVYFCNIFIIGILIERCISYTLDATNQ